MKECWVGMGSVVHLALFAGATSRVSWAGGKSSVAPILSSWKRAQISTRSRNGYYTLILTSNPYTSASRTISVISCKASLDAETASSSCSPQEENRDDLDAHVRATVAASPRRPRCAVVGGGFAGLATAYHLVAYGSDVTVFDPNEVGAGGASSVAGGLLHPLTPRGKMIWKGLEGLAAAKELIEVANGALAAEGCEAGATANASRGCVTTERVYRPIMDEKAHKTFSKSAEELPEWIERLPPEEFLRVVPGADRRTCLGGVRIRGALAVDSPTYLRGLWAACVALANRIQAAANPGDSGSPRESARWIRERVEDVHALAGSTEFDAVVACVGPEAKVLPGVRDIASLRLTRGQSLIYSNAATPPHQEPLESSEDGEEVETAAERAGKQKMLTSAVLCGEYVVPVGVDEGGIGDKLVCGSTQEPILYPDALRKPADMDEAIRLLRPKVAKLYPALQGAEPLDVTSGIRVIRDRDKHGRIPIAGRLPFSARGWVIAALGARGLIHHAYLGRLIAACALLDDDKHLPPQVTEVLRDLGGEPSRDL